jgi:hypothetical protein
MAKHKILCCVEEKQKVFLDRFRRGMRGHVVRQCLEMGEMLADAELLTPTGFNMVTVRQIVQRGMVK